MVEKSNKANFFGSSAQNLIDFPVSIITEIVPVSPIETSLALIVNEWIPGLKYSGKSIDKVNCFPAPTSSNSLNVAYSDNPPVTETLTPIPSLLPTTINSLE